MNTRDTVTKTRENAIEKIAENWTEYLIQQVKEGETEVLHALVLGVGAKSITLMTNEELSQEWKAIFGEILIIGDKKIV